MLEQSFKLNDSIECYARALAHRTLFANVLMDPGRISDDDYFHLTATVIIQKKVAVNFRSSENFNCLSLALPYECVSQEVEISAKIFNALEIVNYVLLERREKKKRSNAYANFFNIAAHLSAMPWHLSQADQATAQCS